MSKLNLIEALKNSDRLAFETAYQTLAPARLEHIFKRIRDKEASEGLVQEIFLSLWKRRAELNVASDLRSYLYGAAKFQVLNYIRQQKQQQRYAEHFAVFAAQSTASLTQDIYADELMQLVLAHLERLPAKCREAFRLSRFENKSIDEIAEEMGISRRTVENYLTQALKHLRQVLSRYVWLLLLL